MPVAALDIGGTHVSAARVDVQAASVEPGSRRRLPLRPDGGRDELLGVILRAAELSGAGTSRLGVAVPGPFDYERGICTIRGVGKLESLYGVDLRAELARVLGLLDSTAVRFLNDAEAFLLGEWWAGEARGYGRAIGVTLGTGLGSAFLADGRIVATGSDVPPEGSLHLTTLHGRPVEELVSSRGLLARYDSGANGDVDVAGLGELARSGDARAGEAFRDTASALGECLAPWIRSFQPAVVVIGGSIAGAWDLLGPVLEAEVRGLVPVVRAANLDDAPLLGAARYAAEPA